MAANHFAEALIHLSNCHFMETLYYQIIIDFWSFPKRTIYQWFPTQRWGKPLNQKFKSKVPSEYPTSPVSWSDNRAFKNIEACVCFYNFSLKSLIWKLMEFSYPREIYRIYGCNKFLRSIFLIKFIFMFVPACNCYIMSIAAALKVFLVANVWNCFIVI